MSCLVVFMRHAITDWNEAKLLQGRADRPLSPAGRALAIQWRVPASLGLPADAPCFASPLVRCLETARLMGLKPTIEPDLIEASWGEWEGKRLADMRAADPAGVAAREAAGLDFRPPGGESARDVQARLAPFLARRIEAGTPALAIAHRGVTRAVYALAVQWDMTGPPPDKLLPGCAHAFRLEKGRPPAVEALNQPLMGGVETAA